jgi:OPT oligopeptide transporter protein
VVSLHVLCVLPIVLAYRVCMPTTFAVTMFVFGVVAIEVWNTEFPVWAFVLALLICASTRLFWDILSLLTFVRSAFVYTVPIGVILAITNQEVGLNVITELIIGYALPGRPIAMMMFKTWGYITMAQALGFTADFKLGHYMKIPHRPMFLCQVVATVLAGTVQLGVQAWMFSHIEDICSPDQKDGFICPSTTVFGTASIVVCHLFLRSFLVNVITIVGCDWTATCLLTWSTLLWPRLLLPDRCDRSGSPMDFAQEVWVKLPEVPQFPAYLLGHGLLAACDAAQLRALGASLLPVQLRHSSPPFCLVVKV